MKTIPQLIKSATRHFNEYIRNRDQDKPCISCGKYTTLQAGHFYSAGHYPALRYDEDNTWGQCLPCNYFRSGNLIEYEKNLRRRIGDDRVESLHLRAGYYKRNGYKWDRFHLEEVIREYREKKKIYTGSSTK
jgi:gamma-glutamylcyclotransferase (GGCT)/AIG2-like uncharacterized protein YtfP